VGFPAVVTVVTAVAVVAVVAVVLRPQRAPPRPGSTRKRCRSQIRCRSRRTSDRPCRRRGFQDGIDGLRTDGWIQVGDQGGDPGGMRGGGAAAEVPEKFGKPVTSGPLAPKKVVSAPSGAEMAGCPRTSGVARRFPAVSKRMGVPPAEEKFSMSCGFAQKRAYPGNRPRRRRAPRVRLCEPRRCRCVCRTGSIVWSRSRRSPFSSTLGPDRRTAG
jgi:hypothetical protein